MRCKYYQDHDGGAIRQPMDLVDKAIFLFLTGLRWVLIVPGYLLLGIVWPVVYAFSLLYWATNNLGSLASHFRYARINVRATAKHDAKEKI